MSLIVKICGLSTRETLDVALQAGADMVGFVFFPASPRHIGLNTARDLGRQAKGRALKVALTVDADDATLANVVEALQPEILQLHGKETVARLRDIKQTFGLQVMKAIAVETQADLAALPGYAARFRLRFVASGGVNGISATLGGQPDAPESVVALIGRARARTPVRNSKSRAFVEVSAIFFVTFVAIMRTRMRRCG